MMCYFFGIANIAPNIINVNPFIKMSIRFTFAVFFSPLVNSHCDLRTYVKMPIGKGVVSNTDRHNVNAVFSY